MNSNNESHCVAVFDTHQGAEVAIADLQRAGFDMKKLSIVGRDFHTEEHAVGFYNAGERVKSWGKNGAFWGASKPSRWNTTPAGFDSPSSRSTLR